MKTYRVAILGCRGRGTMAARAYYQHPRTQLVGLCDLLPELLEKLGEEVEVTAHFSDFHEMIEKTGPDIVAIPTGTEFHYDLSMQVMGHGVHIDVEKPMCTNLAEADDMLSRAREKGVQIAVHHQGRTSASMVAVDRAIQAGKIGQVRYVYGSGKGYYGGYGLMNIGTHMLNYMLRAAGRARSVTATALTDGRPIEPEDVIQSAGGMGIIAGEHITATLEFASGATGTLLQHRFPKMDVSAHQMEVYGTEGRVVWKSSNAWYLPVPHTVPNAEGTEWEELPLIYPDSYDASGPASEADYGYVDEYVNALDEGRPHQCSGLEGAHVLELMMGIFASGAYGRRIELLQQERQVHPLLRWRREAGLEDPPDVPRPYGEWLEAEDRRLGRN